MIALSKLRFVGPWLLGLFLVAQVAGILPMVAVHIQHALASQRAASDDLVASGHIDRSHERHGHHSHGTTDANDQCCTVHHHLVGVVSSQIRVVRCCPLTVQRVARPQDPLLETILGLPERPPKLSLSV
jgi:hypothetical protein